MSRVTLNIEDFVDIPTAEIFNPDEFKAVRNVTIDSRKVKKGSLFIAIKGKRFDGHSFVRSAVKNGVTVLLINRKKINEFDDIDLPIITVKNTTKALGEIAKLWRKKLSTKIIGITGSNGKTSTKDMLAALLNEKYKVNKTESNNNNHIGVPLTILATNEKHDVLVAELGTNHFGEIEYSAKILQPDIALITNIGDSHLEYLKNRKGVLKEKIALFDETRNNKGKIFINYDDPLLKNLYDKFNNCTTYGFKNNVEVKGKILNYTDDGRPVIEIKHRNKKIKNTLPSYGEQSANNYLAAVSIALNLGLTKEQIKRGTENISITDGRLNVKHHNNFLLIDDTYNASPDSTIAAIELVERIKTYERKVLILGDMFELGKDNIELHRSLSSIIIKSSIDELYTIGSGMKALHVKLINKRIITKHFRTRKSLQKFISNYNLQNTVILVKGSRGMRMEEFANTILSKTKS
ncbi:MAG: UDP-N-acetylmuramoyl-tripeptide--D-alanyl-D-alanine ligase [Ignavibacteria bacterium]|nr:MAG: UDP-N-acetylmuramoyl-tripeptide--D-alanyl-D-alanine ligase [Ignavibacteria bacterium]